MEEIVKAILKYKSAVNGKLKIMYGHFGNGNLMAGWRRGQIPKRGELKDAENFSYYFHGAGCTFETKEWDVNFDFGKNAKFKGVDAWKVWCFITQFPEEFPTIQQESDFNFEIEKLLRRGVLFKGTESLDSALLFLNEYHGF